MKHCSSCGADVADNAKSCPKCGAVLNYGKDSGGWTYVLGIASLVFAIIGAILALFSLIPYLGLFLVYPVIVIGVLTLIASIVSCIFAPKKGVCVTGIVFSSIDLLIAIIRLVALLGLAAL